jgi:hypothetical protein
LFLLRTRLTTGRSLSVDVSTTGPCLVNGKVATYTFGMTWAFGEFLNGRTRFIPRAFLHTLDVAGTFGGGLPILRATCSKRTEFARSCSSAIAPELCKVGSFALSYHLTHMRVEG